MQNFPLLKFHPLSSDVNIMLHLWSAAQNSYPKYVHRPTDTSFSRIVNAKSGNSKPSHPLKPVLLPHLYWQHFHHRTACNYFQVHIMQDAEDAWHFLFFFIHDWPYFLMQACWQAILAYVFWTITLGPIHQLQPNLKSLYSSRNTMIIRGWRSGTLLNLSISGGNTAMATIYNASSSWTISRQVAPNLERIWHDLLRRQPPKLCKNPRES